MMKLLSKIGNQKRVYDLIHVKLAEMQALVRLKWIWISLL